MAVGWRLPDAPLRQRVLAASGAGLLAVAGLSILAASLHGFGDRYPFKASAVFALVAVVVVGFVRDSHPFPAFGPANYVTSLRAVLVALVAGLIGEEPRPDVAVFAAVVGAIVTGMDGVDGWLARRSGMASAFGARFDMEIDALLILALSILAWQFDKAGAWVILAGLMRYLFVAAGWLEHRLEAPLYPSRRRQTVCVVQILGLGLVMLPAVTRPASAWLAAGLVLLLGYSFAVDTIWLLRDGASASRTADVLRTSDAPRTSYFALVVALLVLDASLTFHNVWPTPGVAWGGALSVELALLLLVFAAAHRWWRPPSPRALRVLTALWLLLILGRYTSVTAPALWGRDLNFYWHLRLLPDVASMLARAAQAWMVIAVVLVVCAVVAFAYVAVRWALRLVARATADPRFSRTLVVVAAAIVFAFTVQRAFGWTPLRFTFPSPVVATFARQAGFVREAIIGNRPLPPSPSFESDWTRVQGADVLVLFVESYGAVTFERSEFAQPLEPGRQALTRAISESGYGVASAFAESPTFGGSSWFAHITLLSGLHIGNPDLNAQLMTETRDTLAKAFARHGYRSVAMMPGIWSPWPEGEFYGFGEIYNGERLDYGERAPFGWFQMTDQFVLARLDERELDRTGRPPVFAFFPTVSTHTPFAPTPPYQPDWPRILSLTPYDERDLEKTYDDQPEWTNLGPKYVQSVAYIQSVLAGYIRKHANRDLVLIVLGDHQPPALVAGENAPWDVPVHIITNRAPILERLKANGFKDGLTPDRPTLGPMERLVPMLLDAFGDKR